MDDFSTANLNEARNEFAQRLLTVLVPQVIIGIQSIFDESYNLCVATGEQGRYRTAFQNALSSVVSWNALTVEARTNQIMVNGKCSYLADLLSCVHIIQVKILSCMRVGNRQKSIELVVPNLNMFIHNVYVAVARKVYLNVYLFDPVSDIVRQKYNHDLETLVEKCILTVVRDSVPTESIIRAYLDESVEQEEEVFIEPVPDPDPVAEADEAMVRAKMAALGQSVDGSVDGSSFANGSSSTNSTEETGRPVRGPDPPPPESQPGGQERSAADWVPTIRDLNQAPIVTRLTFNDTDTTSDGDEIHAPKSIQRLDMLAAAKKAAEAAESSYPTVTESGGSTISLDDLFDLDSKPASSRSDPGSNVDIALEMEEYSA